MIHVGFVTALENNRCIILDRRDNAHLYIKKDDEDIVKGDHVTYWGEEDIVERVIPLRKYTSGVDYKGGIPNYIYSSMSGLILIDDKLKKHILDSFWPESDVIGLYIARSNHAYIKLEPLTYKEFSSIYKKAYRKVLYVRSHLDEIANSYYVEDETSYYCKPGGDDRMGTDRRVSINYSDVYVDKFFPEGGEVSSSSGYGLSVGYNKERRKDIEDAAKENFLNNYNEEEHLLTLLYSDYIKLWNHLDSDICHNKEIASCGNNLGVSYGRFVLDKDMDATIESIHRYNNLHIKDTSF